MTTELLAHVRERLAAMLELIDGAAGQDEVENHSLLWIVGEELARLLADLWRGLR